MKLAFIAEWLDPWRGGAETSTLQFIHHLVDRGVEVHVFTRSRLSPMPGMAVHTISGASLSRTRRSITFARRVQTRLRREHFDLVHTNTPCRGADVYQPRGGTAVESIARNLALRRTASGRSLKNYANRFNFKQRYELAQERAAVCDPDGPVIAAISNYVARQFKQHYGLADDRVRVVYNGVNPDTTPPETRRKNRRRIRAEFGVADDDLLVLLVAHNFRLKGVQRWMEAHALLVSRGRRQVRCLVVGNGESARWHGLARRMGIDRHLTFVGPSERVGAFRHASDVLVHPTYYDPCSRVVLEALTTAMPCITTRWDGACEVIEHGVSGFVLDDPWDVESLAGFVLQLEDEETRRRIAEAAERVSDQVSMARHADQMLMLFEDLLQAGTPT